MTITQYYWDSCAWLGLLNGEQDKRRELEIVFETAKSQAIEIWTSAVALVETNRFKTEDNKNKPLSADNAKTIQNLFAQPFIKIVPVDVEIGNEARRLIRETPNFGNKFDAVHLASAMRWGLPVMHTYDRDDLLALDGKLVNSKGEKLEICYPDRHTDGPLFEHAKKK